MWINNVLEVTGTPAALADFRAHNSKSIERGGKVIEIPLCFGKLLLRPEELSVEESSVGLRGYQALYGDWEKLLTYPWLKERGATDRHSLIRLLEQLDPNHMYLAQTYRRNECKHGFRNWYTWNLEHFGTKHDLDTDTVVEDSEEGVLKYRFKTYENPPLAWLEIAQSTYDRLKFRLGYRSLRRTEHPELLV